MSYKNNASARLRSGGHPLSHKIASVAASALLVWSMWPTGALAEVQKELTAAQEEAVEQTQVVDAEDDADVVVDQDSAETTSAETAEVTDEGEKTAEANGSEADDAPAAADDAATADAATEDAATDEVPTEADIALSLGSAYITYNNQNIAAPMSKVTVPTSDDFKFTATANEGYELTAVYLTVANGEKTEIDPDANFVFTVSAADIIAGAAIELEAEKLADGSVATSAAVVVASDTEIVDDSNTLNNNLTVDTTDDSADASDDATNATDDATNATDDANVPMVVDEVSTFDGTVTGNDTLEVGKFAIYTANGFSDTVWWTTSDTSIATVEQNGVVTAVATGTVKITAEVGDESASKTITVVEASSESGYKATITPTIENTEVAYFAWHDTSDTSNIAFSRATGTVTVNDYTTSSKPGYIVFFVKPNSNHIVTGLGASGNGDIYAVDGTSWGNINGYPNIAQVMAAAKAAGYVAAFGWSRGSGSTLNADFTISSKSPDMTVTAVLSDIETVEEASSESSDITVAAVSDSSTGVVAGDKLTFTVTITPQTTGSGKDSVTGVRVNSADVNGTVVEVENLTQNADGTSTGLVHYTATDADVARGSVVLSVEATSTYAGTYTISSGDMASTATVTKKAIAKCRIAPASQVEYSFVSGTDGKSLPGKIYDYLPSDSKSYGAGKTVKAKDPSATVYEDSKNDGYWTFTGWDKNSVKVGRNGETVAFTGTWTFTQYSKYTIKYVDESGTELANSYTVTGNKVNDTIKVSDIEKPSIAGYSYKEANPSSTLTITSNDDANVITLTYKKKTGKAGYNLVLDGATWTAPGDTTQQSGTQKWYYNYGFAKDDTFTVTESKPTANNHVFIGWMDKERDDQAAAIRNANDVVTYCYSKSQTYTLDALWASLGATGEDVIYDGSSHSLTVDVNINNTGLDEKYVKQAKDLITAGTVYYSTDGGETWTETAPSYTDAGEYPVKVKQEVTVGNATAALTADATTTPAADTTSVTTTLYAETTIKIAPKTYYVTTNTDSKPYDGTELVGTATVEGIITGESATATATTIGPDVTASTTNAVTGEIAWGANTKASNYTRGTDQLGTLEIKMKEAKEYTATVSIQGWTYDGTFHSTDNLTSSNNAGGGQGTYTYYKKNDDGSSWTYLSAAPVDAGDYKVVANWAASKNYPALSAEREFTISKRAIEVTGSFTTEYTGEEQTKYIYAEDGKQVEGVTVSGVVSGETLKLWDCSISGTDVGTYTTLSSYQWSVTKSGSVTRSAVDSTSNYTISVSGTLTITEKGGLSLNAVGYSGSYDGQAHAGTVTPNVTTGTTVQYSTDGGKTWTEVAPTITDVVRASDGSVSKIDVKVRAYNPNYTNKDVDHALTADYSLQVNPLTITVTDSKMVNYNGQAQELELTAAKAQGLLDGETLTLSGAKVTGTAASSTAYTQVSSYTWSVAKADGTTDSKGNYNINVTGSLTINAKSLTNDMVVNSPSNSVYDGTAHQWTKIEVKDGDTGLTKGTDYTVTYKRGDAVTEDFTSAGSITVVITGINNYSGTVTKSYEIAKRQVTFTGNSDNKTYNGSEQSVEGYTTNAGEGTGLVSDQTANVEAKASRMLPGTTNGTITAVKDVAITDAQGNDVTANYNITTVAGSLTITGITAPITITAGSASKTYDGTPLTTSEYTYTQGVLLDGDVLTATVTGSKTEVGNDGVSSIASYKVMRGDTEVTSAYTFAESANGNLTVNKRPVTITANSGEFTYDGTAKTVSGVTTNGLATNQTTNLTAGRTETAAGEYEVDVPKTDGGEYDLSNCIHDAAGNNVSSNYDITIKKGSLKIGAKSIDSDGMTVSDPANVVYNGREQKWAPVVKDGTKALVEGMDYTVTYSDDVTNVGTVTVTISGTGNYTGTVERTYDITRRPVTIKSGSASKAYDGSPLTSADASVTSYYGFVDGEVTDIEAIGSITDLGSVENEISYVVHADAGFLASNYDITLEPGTLTVTAKSIIPNPDVTGGITVNDPANVTYDGYEHKWDPIVTDTGREEILDEGTDYEVSYNGRTDFTNVDGTITVTITGKGNYTGSFDRTYQITKAQLIVVTSSASKSYDGTALTAIGSISGFVGTEEADFSTTGSQTTVGSSTNWYKIDWKGASAKQGNYEISEQLGTLTVTESTNEVVVTTTGGTWTYDGAPHGATVAVTNLPASYTAEATSNATATDANGEGITATADNLVIKNTEGVDVTSSLTVTKVDGTIKIKPAELTVETFSAKKPYDGSALTAGGKISGFVGNETATLVTKGSQTLVGKSSNGYEISWNDNAKDSNYTVKSETLGELEVTPNTAAIYVIPNGASKVYDGTALEGKDATATVMGVPSGFTSSYTLKGSQTDKGSSYVEVDTFKIFNAAGEDVTNQFSGIKTEFKNYLTVTARPVTLTSGSASKVYDGEELVEHSATASETAEDTGMVAGQDFDFEFDGSQTDAGSSPNIFSAKDSATAKVDNYNITYSNGTLTVTKQSIDPGPDENPDPSYQNVTVDDPSNSKYDTQNHQWVPTVKDKDGLALTAGTDYIVTYKRGESETTDFKNAGTIKVVITGIGNYSGEVTKTYQITKRQVTLTSDSGDKKYDGKPIQRHGVTVSGDGFAAGENVSQNYTWYDSNFILPNAEGYVNKFDYELKSGTNADNYEITKVYGTLVVNKATAQGNITLTVSDKVETYDGNTYSLPVATATVKYDNVAKIEYSLDGQKWSEDASEFTATDVADSKVVSVRASSANFDGYVYGTEKLTINARKVTITSADGDFIYNGQDQKAEDASVTSGSFVGEEGVASCSYSNSVKNVGDVKDNAFTYVLRDNTVAGNYEITKVYGTLSVRKDENSIVVKLTGYEGVYDGASHQATGSIAGTLPAGFTYEITSNASITNVGETTASVDAFVIKDAYGNDATSQFNVVKTATATLKVTPATLNVTTLGGEKVYDGEALTAAATAENLTGLVNNETATLVATGSQTYVGQSDNTYRIEWGTADKKNYTVVSALGLLKVTEPAASKVIAKAHEAGTYGLGDVVKFTITATNVYATAQTMTITEQEGVSLDQSVFENVQPGASVTATATYTITEADILGGGFKNTATVSFSGTDKTYSAEDTVTVDEAAALLTVAKSTTSKPANGNTYALGEKITYDVTVTNNGNLTATDVVVSDGLYGATLAEGQSAEVGSLAPGASATVKYEYVVTEGDILAGKVVNNATASGKTADGDPVVTPGSTEDETDPKNGKLTVTKTATSEPADGKAYKLGETISYKIVVTNDGNLTVNGIEVTDANADGFGTKTVESLAPGASAEFEATHKVTEADVLAGEVVNTATAKGTDSSTKEVDTDGSDREPIETADAALTVKKTAEQSGSAEDGAFKLGETINYTITVTNTGNQTVTDVKVSDPNADDFGEKTVEYLAPGESKTFSATHKVTQADILAGEVVNTATAKGTDSKGNDVDGDGTDTKTIDELNTTLTVEKTASAPADGVSYKLGETVTYTITVKNNGNVDYHNVVVTDAKAGLSETIDTLGVGETKTFSATHTITEADIVAGSYANTATAKGDSVTDGKGNDHKVTGEDTETIGGDSTDKKIDEGSADLTVTKTVTNQGTGENGAFKLGETIEYSITVTNNGNLTARNFQVVDNNADGFEPVTIASLAPGETSEAIVAKHVVTSDDILAGSVKNVATTTAGSTDDDKVTPNPTPGEVDTDVDGVDATLEVSKVAAAPATGAYKLGETVTYTVTVTNKGNVPYYNVVVSDAQTGLNETIATLGVGESKQFTTTHVIDEADIVAGTYVNVATAEADPVKDPATGQDVIPSGEGSETIGGKDGEKPIDAADPKLVITKTSDVAEGTLLKEGDVVNYTVTVKNTGNLTVTNIAVDDQLAGVVLDEDESAVIDSLAPGAAATLHYSYTVTQADVVAGQVANHVTASADNSSDKGTDVVPGDKTDPTEAVGASLYIEKTADKNEDVAAGDVITYTIKATNNGNVDLTGVVVTDELTGFASESFDLARGESREFTTTYTVTEADMVAGKVVNVAGATATDPKGGDVDGKGETTSTTEAIDGVLTVEKTPAAGSYAAGDTVTYTIKVTNKGNVTVKGITVADAKTGFSQSDVTLAPGESREFETSYTVTDDDIAAGKVENRATADGTDPAGDPVHGEVTNTVDNHRQDDPDNPGDASLKSPVSVEDPDDVTYNGGSQKQSPVVTDADGNTLVEGVDYDLVYSEDTTNAGTITVTVVGKGNYTGSVDASYQIKPAVLTVTTGSATKSYDGTALTSDELTIEGLLGSDFVVASTTGNQTLVGTSKNTYQIDWRGAKASNYTIVEELGSLTVTEAVPVPTPVTPTTPDNPTPTPTPTPTPSDGGSTPAPAPSPSDGGAADERPAPLDTVVEALETVAETVTGEPVANGETIYDETNPLGTTQNSCWVHFWMFVGIIATAVYGLVVWFHRMNHTKKLRKNMNDLLGGSDGEGAKPVDTTNPAGMEA